MEDWNWEQALEPQKTPEAETKRRKHNFLDILFNQTIYFIVVLIAFFGFKFFGGEAYASFKEELTKSLSQTTTTDTVLDEVEKQEKTEQTDNDDEASSVEETATYVDYQTLDAYAEYAEESDEACVFDLSEIRLLSGNKLSVNSMCMPITSTNVTSAFGYRVNPITGNYAMHSGIDIGANTGDNIYAALSGTVVKAKESYDYGKFVTIDHGDGLVTIYAHCSKLLVEVGDTVEKGQVIALAGSTGWSTGPHLHFEIRVNGIRIDPQYYLTKLYSA